MALVEARYVTFVKFPQHDLLLLRFCRGLFLILTQNESVP